jgi:hypothetical protein
MRVLANLYAEYATLKRYASWGKLKHYALV